MRFAFCIFKYFPYGGIQRDLMKIVDECRSRGHEVKIFTLRWQAPEPDDIDVEVLPIVGLNRHVQYEHFAAEANRRVRGEHFDLVVGFNKMPGLDVYYAGDTCYLEKALHQRSPWYRLLPRFKSLYRAEQAVFDRTSDTRILAISAVEIPRYRHHYQTPPERFYLLPPGIERDRVAPDDKQAVRAEVRAEFGLDPAALLLLFVGSGFIKKGLDRALLAVAALPRTLRDRTHLMVIGRDKGDAFERMTMRLGLSGQVTFFTDGRDDVPRFLFAADGLLHPAYDETAGMVIVEAMLAGVPVLATRNCGYAKYLDQHEAGIVLPLPFSQDALGVALESLLTSPQRQHWIDNGIAAKSREELFQLVPQAVDHLQTFACARAPVLVFALFRYFPYGGLQRDFMRVALACHAAGYRVVVYCLSWQGEIPAGFLVIPVEAPGVYNHTKYRHFAEYVQREARWRRPGAIIGFNKMPGLDLYYAADACFEHKAQTMRSAIYRRTPRYKLMSRYERAVFAADNSTQILLIAPAQRAQFRKYYHTPDERMYLLPPGVSQDRCRGPGWQEQRTRVRDEFGIGADDLLLLLVGSGFITKGLDRALNALASLPESLARRTRLLVIGQDNPQQFLRKARSLKVEERLTILPGRDDIPAILQGADMMVHPAYMESGGMVLLEAIIAGLPVVATGVCGFAHYIEQADAGVVLCEPFVQGQLNEVLAAALHDADQRARWSANGVAFGVAHTELYNMPAKAMQYIEEKVRELSA